MSRSNYDNWNFMGQSLIADSRRKNNSNQLNSTFFILSFIALSLFGLVSIYSASYPITVSLGVKEFDFVIKQTIYLAIGIIVGLLVLFTPEKVISVASYILMVVSLGILGVNTIAGNLYISTEVSFHTIALISILFFASFFASKENCITRLRELLLPVLCVIAMIFLILTQNNIAFSFLFFLIALVMFICGGVGFGGALLLILFAIVPAACSILSNESSVLGFLKVLVPGFGNETSNLSPNFLRLQAISSGRLLGKGLGAGQFKYSLISGIYDNFILCNICEELGVVGFGTLIVIFAIFTTFGYKIAINLREKNAFASNAVTGMVSHIIICLLFNVSSCFNFTTMDCISLPFISFGSSIIPFVIESFLIFKLSKSGGTR